MSWNSKVLPDGFAPSTYLSSNIQTYGDLAYYVKVLLGYPELVEISDETFRVIIDEAIELFTNYTKGEEKYLVFCGDKYIPNCGIKLDELVNPCLDCFQTCESYQITSTTCSNEFLKTETGLLSVSPFTISLTSHFDLSLSESPLIFGNRFDQTLTLSFNPKKPWNTRDICEADCIRFRPKNSNWYQLSTNGYLLSSYITYNNVWSAFSAIPTTEYQNIPTSSLPLSAFYPEPAYKTWPLQACIDILSGTGYLYPDCNVEQYTTCQPASSYWRICEDLELKFLDCNFQDYVYLDNCKHPLSTVDLTAPYLSAYNGHIFKNPRVNVDVDYNKDGLDDNALSQVCYISASDGSIFPPSALNITNYTHFELENFPACIENNVFPINWNNGAIVNFSICNTALNTFGKFPVPCVRFLNDCTVPSEILYQDICDWEHGGFKLVKNLENLQFCSRKNFKCSGEVDMDLYKTICIDYYGTVAQTISGAYDIDKSDWQKVSQVFTAEFARNGSGGFGYGDNYLFSFDYNLAQSLFGHTHAFGMNGFNGVGLVDWYMAKGYVEQLQTMLRYVTYQFNPKTQMLRIMPEPQCNNCSSYCYIVGVYLEPPVKHIINEPFIKDWVYGRALQIIGKVRSRWGTVNLVGGANVNGDAAIQEGDRIIERAMSDLRDNPRYDVPQSIFMK